MGGHAFKDLDCPGMAQDVYDHVKMLTTAALQTIFAHVVVPTEMPCKRDYRDIDLLVAGPRHFPNSPTMDGFDWKGIVSAIKKVFNTTHGHRGSLTTDCMYFAIEAPGFGSEYHTQVNVKVCFKPELFDWYRFELSYASNSKMIASMLKPLGLTINPEGLHIRVEEIEETNFPESMVWISNEPKDVLRIAGLDHRFVNAGFKTEDEIYEYLASSWFFNPIHFAARLAEKNYPGRIEERSPRWIYFLKEWSPKQDAEYVFVSKETPDLQVWYKQTRAALKEMVFTMFPLIAIKYYVKRAAYMEELQERKLREIITKAIPVGTDGWRDDFPIPEIIVEKDLTAPLSPLDLDGASPPLTPTLSRESSFDMTLSEFMAPRQTPPTHPSTTPLYLYRLARNPPLPCKPKPPPPNMSPDRKLAYLARWTKFDTTTGSPYLISAPRGGKAFDTRWYDAVYYGTAPEVLVKWAEEMWWHVWVRQAHVNYVIKWKKRFAKEDREAEKKVLEELAAAEEADKSKDLDDSKVKLRAEMAVFGRELKMK